MADWPTIPPGFGYPLVDMDSKRLPDPTMEAIAGSPELSATTAATVASEIANPETDSNSAVVEVVEGVLGGGVTGLTQVVDARGDSSTARPTWAGIIEWWIDEGQGIPIYLSPGDLVREVAAVAIPFSPLDLNPLAWFDAVALTGYANDATVTTWDNLVTANPDLVTTSGTIQYKSAGLNGGPSLYTAGSSRMLAASFATFTNPLTRFTIAQCTSLPGAADRYAVDILTSTDIDNRGGLRFGPTQWGITRSTGFSGGTSDTNVHLFEQVYDGASSKLIVDSLTPITGSTATGSSTTKLVAFNRGVTAASFIGHIACDILIPSILTTDERDDLRAYLADRYSITL